MLADFEDVLDRLDIASRNGEKAMSFCPAHDDRNNPSLSLKSRERQAATSLLRRVPSRGHRLQDRSSDEGPLRRRGRGVLYPPEHACTLARSERKPAFQWAKRACKW